MIECTAFLGGSKHAPKEKLTYRPAVYALIRHNHHVLLVSTIRSQKYYLPGGGVEIEESLHAALKREVKEETGIEIEVGQLTRFKEDFFYYDPLDEAYHSLLFFYTARPQTFTLASDDEVQDGEVENPRWVPWKDLQARDFHNHGEIIMQMLHSS